MGNKSQKTNQVGNFLPRKKFRIGLIKIASAVFPPIMKDVLKELRNHGTLRFLGQTFCGVFKTFGEVNQHFRGTVAYNSEESEKEEIISAAKFRLAFEDAKRGISPEASDRYIPLCSLVSVWPNPNPTILDVGGGAGSTLAHLVYSCPSKKPNLIVYDLPPVVTAGVSEFQGVEEIHFADNLNDVKPPVDIVFFGSSLQYFEDYESTLHKIKTLNPEIIALSYTPVTSAPTFVTAQVNMRRRIIPTKIINSKNLINFLNQLGFILSYQSVSLASANFRNFPYPQNSSFFTNLVFKKKK